MQFLVDQGLDHPVPVIMNTDVRARGLSPEMLSQMREGHYFNERGATGTPFGNGAGIIGRDFVEFAGGGLVGGLNLINPKSSQKGPLNISLNSNNMLAKSRAGTPAGQFHRGR
jgi:hypothetical protein